MDMVLIDLVVIFDFLFGVMENWGLIIYRMIVVLYDFVYFFIRDKEWVVIVVVYEFVY